jgi:fucose permease
MAASGASWKLNMVLLIVPALILAVLVATSHFPQTERVASGVSYREMLGELVRRPLFWVFWVCMFFTASAELAPGQWVNLTLSNVVGMQGVLLLVYVSSLMFVMRHFAGPLVKHLSSIGLMFVGCLLAGVGLYLLSVANSPVSGLLAATVWGIGVCYLWPTMLAITSERFPRGGALAMGLMGFAGGMAIQFVLPIMGGIFDSAKAEAAGGADRLAGLSPEAMAEVLRFASVESFQSVAILPLVLLPVFGLIWIADKRRASVA